MKITKPLEFLGAYVSRVSISAGWSSAPGVCNLDLVEEPKDNKIFQAPAIGKGCIFKFGKVEFGGFLQRYNYYEDVSGGRRYDLTLSSPNDVLEGIKIILDKFQGTFYNSDSNLTNTELNEVMTYGGKYPTNIINIFASKENYNYGGLFGKSENNGMGYPVANLLNDIQEAIKKGIFAGKVKFYGVEYELDLSELAEPISTIPQYRINEDFTDLNAIVSDICRTASYDYTTFLTGKTNDLGVIVSDAKIKIKVLSRKSPPSLNVIKDTINEYKNKPDKQKILTSYEIGREASNIVTQKVLIGGAATRYWLATTDHILPIWGQLGTGENTKYFYGNSLYEYSNMFAPIRVTIDGGNDDNFTYVDTNLLELRAAMDNSRQCWTAYHLLMALKEGRRGITIGNFSITEDDFLTLLEGKLASQDLMDTDIDNALIYSSWMLGRDSTLELQQAYAQKIINTRFLSLQSAAENFYGSKFLVAIPGEIGGIENNIRFVEKFKYESSWETASSGWAGDNNFEDFSDINFYDESGKFEPIVVYPNYNNIDYSSLGNEYARTRLGTNYGVFYNATIDADWGIKWQSFSVSSTDKSGKPNLDSSGKKISTSNPVGYVKVDIKPLYIFDQYTTEYNGFNALCNLIFGEQIDLGYHNLFGFGNLDFPMPPSRVAPEYIGIPQESKRYVWGPWFSFNKNSGQEGKAEITQDTDLNPESFGSIADMNLYAQKSVNADLATLLETETGKMSLAEEPQFNIAERFFTSGPYISDISITADASGGYITTYTFKTWTTTFGTLSKYDRDLFIKGKKDAISNARKMRSLFRNPVPKAINKNLISKVEKINKESMPSTNVIAGHVLNYISRAINGNLQGKGNRLSFSTSATTATETMRGLATNYTEGFAAGYEQIFTPVFSYNQTNPAKIKRSFNEGQI